MADQEVTPEQIELMRAYGQALRSPYLPSGESRTVSHPLMAIGNILSALAGHRMVNQSENLRLQQRRARASRFLPEDTVPRPITPPPASQGIQRQRIGDRLPVQPPITPPAALETPPGVRRVPTIPVQPPPAQPQTPPGAPEMPPPTPMRLGGPTEEERAALPLNRGTQVAQNLPVGTPNRIEPDPNIAVLERQLRNAGSLTEDELKRFSEQYMTLTGPQQREVPGGTAYYNGRTGELMYVVPKLLDRPISAGGVTTQERMLLGPSGAQIVPTGPLNAPNGGQVPGGGQRTEFGIRRDFPQTGRFGDYIQFGQESEAAKRLVESNTGSIATAITNGSTAARQINLYNTLLAASRTGGFIRGQPTADYIQNVRTLLSNLDPYLPEFMRVGTRGISNADIITKLNGQLSFLAASVFSTRGTNLELNTAMTTIPGLANSQASIEALVDILKQEAQSQIRLARQAQSISSDPSRILEWGRILTQEYLDHPITIRLPDGRRIRPINNRSEVEALPPGTWFVGPNGGEPQQRR